MPARKEAAQTEDRFNLFTLMKYLVWLTMEFAFYWLNQPSNWPAEPASQHAVECQLSHVPMGLAVPADWAWLSLGKLCCHRLSVGLPCQSDIVCGSNGMWMLENTTENAWALHVWHINHEPPVVDTEAHAWTVCAAQCLRIHPEQKTTYIQRGGIRADMVF